MEDYLRQSLPYLQSPQEPLREAAVMFLGEPQPCRGTLPAPRQLSSSHGCCQICRAAAEPCLPHVGPTGIPAALLHLGSHTGSPWELCWVSRSLLGLPIRGTALGSALPRGRKERGQAHGAGGRKLGLWAGRLAGCVTGCVCLGLIGRQQADVCQEKLRVIYEEQ